MKRKIWLLKDLIGSRDPTDSEHRAIYNTKQSTPSIGATAPHGRE